MCRVASKLKEIQTGIYNFNVEVSIRLKNYYLFPFSGHEVSRTRHRNRDLTCAFLSAKSWRALTRVFLERGTRERGRRVFNCDRRTGDFLRSLGAVLRRGGSPRFPPLVPPRRKSLFPLFFFFAVPPRALSRMRSPFRARRRPRDPMPRGHVAAPGQRPPPSSASSSSSIPCSLPFSLPSSIFHLEDAAREFLENTYVRFARRYIWRSG